MEVFVKKTMPKPVNWQDFESLCKKLWGELWKCPSIKKNGRLGQIQNGVDVYGIPEGCNNYYGIQCKGKDDYTHSQLTIDEIDNEIKKAKDFNPPLASFIFATTSNKDVKTEEYIRCKNIESRNEGLFSIDIFSWEDLVDLIESNKTVYEWYLKNILHENNYSMSLEINGNSKEIILVPVFEQINLTIRKTFPKIEKKILEDNRNIFQNSYGIITKNIHEPIVQARLIIDAKEYDLSYSKIDIDFFNTGDTALEYYKLFISFNDDRVMLSEKNYKYIGLMPEIDFYTKDYYIDGQNVDYICNNTRPILVPDDGKRITIYTKLPPENFDFLITYRFISKDFKCEGKIICKVEPDIEIKTIIRDANEGEEESYSENIHPKTYLQENQ
jgi:hypothetical protein